MLIHRARNLLNVEDKNLILRIKNRHGNTALHEAAICHHVGMVRRLLSEDSEPVYWMNVEKKSPLYLALYTSDSAIHNVLFSLLLEPSRIQGLPPVPGAILRKNYDLAAKILKKNIKLFAMTDSRSGHVIHLAAYTNQTEVFELLLPKTEYLARAQDMNGDLPIYIASKMGYVELIEKLYPISEFLNGRGQWTSFGSEIYTETSELRMLINDRYYAGNTALHLAVMHSQPVALIPLVLDKRINLFVLKHECLTALDIAQYRIRREYALRK
ncbi:ankyrin repeat-containing protein At2g01680-like [Eucalyptus grandis]|uniref:ankyrin repeat-containing protein At2g01680-like n=1 Tax=Eucalyptus grandis TaxID=71139 RepID=UPI00192E922F|nr:ankyrin repeat-containing protein At2g01680-like [Eucalyptus grandis]